MLNYTSYIFIAILLRMNFLVTICTVNTEEGKKIVENTINLRNYIIHKYISIYLLYKSFCLIHVIIW